MKTKFAQTLAREYGFNNETEYFNYIIDSLANGQAKQAKELFLKMDDSDKEWFLINHLDLSIGMHNSTLNTCIKALIYG